jgi:hypothetical protein
VGWKTIDLQCEEPYNIRSGTEATLTFLVVTAINHELKHSQSHLDIDIFKMIGVSGDKLTRRAIP